MSFISNRLRKSAGHHDARCMFEIAGVCIWPQTHAQVLCHLPYAGSSGMGQKCDDYKAAFGCSACHDVMDGRVRMDGMSKGSVDWLHYALRARDRQTDWWKEHGFMEFK